MQHIDMNLVPKKHPPMYLLHKYWARKPYNVVSAYIKCYSKEGDIVLDPFCGSGVTAIEALKIGRKAIAIDLDPMAVFITKITAIPVDLKKVEEEFDNIKKDIKTELDKLYITNCTECNKIAIIQHIVFEQSKPINIHFKCPNCDLTSDKPFSKEDKENENNIENMRIPYWYPNNELIWNSRVNAKRGMKISDLFSKRNTIALSIIYHRIEQIKDEEIRNIFKFIFSSMLSQASKMLVYTKGQGPGWKVRGFWIPRNRYEMNVWHFFKNRYKKFLRGKQESNEIINDLYKEGEEFSDLLSDKTIWISQQSALNLSNIPSESIDYVFTDPPYGDAIPYLELDYFWSSWLQFSPNFEEEIIISDSPIRHKNFDEYYRMLIQAFKEIFRVLKSDKWMTVTFHSKDIEIYNSIIRAIAFAGFELEKIVYQYPAKTSAKAQLAPYGSATGDYYLRFKKPLRKRELQSEECIDMARFEFVVVDSIKKIIADRGEPTTYNDILKGIYPKLDEYGYLLVAKPEKIENIIRKYENDEFIFVEGEGWWFKDPSKYWLHIVPLQDRVETTIIQVLHNKFRASFDEILQELFETFPNSLTPNPPSIKAILEEYAKQTPEGKWQLIQKTIEREREHSLVIGHLAELGIKAGFKIWIGRREQGDIYEGKRLSELSETKHRLSFSSEELEHIEMIDVLWIADNQIIYEFEVENTTSITEAITRGSYIQSMETKRFIVIPEEREKLLFKKVNAPILKDRIEKYRWQFIFYKDLEEFYLGYKRKKEIDPIIFDSLGKTPKQDRQKQTKIGEFV